MTGWSLLVPSFCTSSSDRCNMRVLVQRFQSLRVKATRVSGPSFPRSTQKAHSSRVMPDKLSLAMELAMSWSARQNSSLFSKVCCFSIATLTFNGQCPDDKSSTRKYLYDRALALRFLYYLAIEIPAPKVKLKKYI